MVNHISSIKPAAINPVVTDGKTINKSSIKTTLSFSKHLNERLERRNLNMTSERLERVSKAVDKVANRGGKDSVVLLDELALLVNVPSKTVITAIETNKMKEGIFTNIDSIVVG